MSTPFLYIQLHIFAKFNKIKNSIKQYWGDGDDEKNKIYSFTCIIVYACDADDRDYM